MTTTTTNKSNPKPQNKPNGIGTPDHSEQPAVSPTSAPANTTPTSSEKKPVTVMIPEALHRKVKVLAELAGISLSDLVEEQLRVVVRERLPGLLSKLDTEN